MFLSLLVKREVLNYFELQLTVIVIPQGLFIYSLIILFIVMIFRISQAKSLLIEFIQEIYSCILGKLMEVFYANETTLFILKEYSVF
jgi:hypothetical protein